jgi:hypothetical protein
MHRFTANEMKKFREMADYIRSLDSSVRGISREDGINIVIAMVNRDRPMVDSLLKVRDPFELLDEAQSDSCPETGIVYGENS